MKLHISLDQFVLLRLATVVPVAKRVVVEVGKLKEAVLPEVPV